MRRSPDQRSKEPIVTEEPDWPHHETLVDHLQIVFKQQLELNY